MQIATSLNLIQNRDTDLVEQWIETVFNALPDKVSEYKKGKKALQGLFAGEIKKLSKGKADMQLVNKLLQEKLNQ
jgi:aspartyl-tRNA(Asn)/glutamyl-tRNA(Gln) amidotransferase subunit B